MTGTRSLARIVLVLHILVWTAPVPAASARPTLLEPDGTLLIEGERSFPIGIYEFPQEDAVLREIAEAGFNLIRCSASTEHLDRAASAGLKAWISLGNSMDVRDNASRDKLAGIIAGYKDHPALVVWEAPDEPLWNVWYSTFNWFHGEQPRLFREHIESAKKAGKTVSPMQAVLRHYQTGLETADYAGAESAASKLWQLLEMKSPKPDLPMTTAPRRARELADGLFEGYELVRQMDLAHPLWINHAPRNTIPDLAYFNRAGDIVGCDIYPVPEVPQNGHSDLANRRINCVGDYTDRMRAAAPGKPAWMVLQGFGWGDLSVDWPEPAKTGRRPTYAETRFMAYDAIVHGAKGILYWGTHYVEKPSPFWTDLKRVVRELHEMQHVLAAPFETLNIGVTLEPTLHSTDRGIAVMAKRVDGRLVLIVVNELHEPVSFSISGLPLPDGTRLRDDTGTRTVTVKGRRIPYSLRRYGIAVLMGE